MDFDLHDFCANLTLSLDELWNPQVNYNIVFSDVAIEQKGVMVKEERDVWQLSQILNNGNDELQQEVY